MDGAHIGVKYVYLNGNNDYLWWAKDLWARCRVWDEALMWLGVLSQFGILVFNLAAGCCQWAG